ncbi:hypothetical protein Tco_0731463 [Tanacetum coccineum]
MYTFSPMMVANSRKHHCRVRPYTREVLVISTNLDLQKNHYHLEFTNRRGVEARIKNTWLLLLSLGENGARLDLYVLYTHSESIEKSTPLEIIHIVLIRVTLSTTPSVAEVPSASALQVLRRLGSIFTSMYAAVHKLKDSWLELQFSLANNSKLNVVYLLNRS